MQAVNPFRRAARGRHLGAQAGEGRVGAAAHEPPVRLLIGRAGGLPQQIVHRLDEPRQDLVPWTIEVHIRS